MSSVASPNSSKSSSVSRERPDHHDLRTYILRSRKVVIWPLATDPDIRIQEEFEPGQLRNKVAIEIKGGTDISNAHNRAGEAEKSHQKGQEPRLQRLSGHLISKAGLNVEN